MGVKNYSGVRREIRGGKPRLIIDFPYKDKNGKKCRFRRDAAVQNREAAHNEAKRLMANAAATGSPEGLDAEQNKPSALTFKAFVEGQWSRDYLPLFKPSTRKHYLQVLRGLIEQLGDIALADLGAAQVRGYAARMKERGVDPGGAVGLVGSILKAAHEAKVIGSVPNLRGIHKRTEKIPLIYSDREVELLVAETTGWLRTAIALGGYAGLRVSEALALEVGDVDLEGQRLVVRRSLSDKEVTTTKSGKERVVPLAPPLIEVLRGALKDKLPKARVINRKTGTYPLRQNVYSALRRAQVKLELQPRSFHSLRHSFCTLLLRTGAHVDAVRRLAGHSDLATTQRYLHTSGDELAEAVARLGKAR